MGFGFRVHADLVHNLSSCEASPGAFPVPPGVLPLPVMGARRREGEPSGGVLWLGEKGDAPSCPWGAMGDIDDSCFGTIALRRSACENWAGRGRERERARERERREREASERQQVTSPSTFKSG